MASTTQNVVRYTALLGGIFYGITHQSTLQRKFDDEKTAKAQHHREHLIEQAREAYAKKKAEEAAGAKKGSGLITDPEDPKFDLEALINSWTEAKA